MGTFNLNKLIDQVWLKTRAVDPGHSLHTKPKQNKIGLTRIKLQAKIPCNMYYL